MKIIQLLTEIFYYPTSLAILTLYVHIYSTYITRNHRSYIETATVTGLVHSHRFRYMITADAVVRVLAECSNLEGYATAKKKTTVLTAVKRYYEISSVLAIGRYVSWCMS